LWQTMAGAWPLEQDRCLVYMEKAVREAGLHTTWTDPDPAYERSLAALVARAYADQQLLAELEALVAEIAPAGRVKAATLALLRLTSPGVPDTYQGTETEQLVLVDPDNRHPVPFEPDTSLKFQVTRTTLRLRRDRPDLFTGYRPLTAPHHLVAFTRGGDRLVVVATRFTMGGGAEGGAGKAGAEAVGGAGGGGGGEVGGAGEEVGGEVGRGPEADGWIDLPAGPWHDVLSGADHPGGPTPADRLLAALPHALLVRRP
jgi:(1->4)-alpha-D-glucan 1-alpha-D-glucosylmutase